MPNLTVMLQATMASVAVGAVHFGSHTYFGKKWAFEKAGVRRTGMVVMAVTWLVTAFFLSNVM